MKTNLQITIWRDSVAAGDDADAPHELLLEVTPQTTLQEITDYVLGKSYLASISGGRATWTLQSERPLAVIAQQWEQPHFLIPPETPVWDCVQLDMREPPLVVQLDRERKLFLHSAFWW